MNQETTPAEMSKVDQQEDQSEETVQINVGNVDDGDRDNFEESPTYRHL